MSSPNMNPYSADTGPKTIQLGRSPLVLGAIFASSAGIMMLLNSHAHQAANEVRVLLVGGGVLAVLGVLLGVTLPPKTKVPIVLAAAVLAASTTAIGIVVTAILAGAATAGTPSCPGPYDCDNALGVGMMIMTAVLAPVYLALIYVGRLTQYLARRV